MLELGGAASTAVAEAHRLAEGQVPVLGRVAKCCRVKHVALACVFATMPCVMGRHIMPCCVSQCRR